MKKKYRVLFCDLDGTLIDTVSGETFPKGNWDMKFKFDVLDAIRKFAPECVFIVSNQGGIEKGFIDYNGFCDKMDYICSCIEEYCKVELCRSRFCPSNDKNDDYRKPNTGMLKDLMSTFNVRADKRIEKDDCLMIGDASGLEGQWSDTDKKTAIDFGIDYMDINEFVTGKI